MISTSQDGLGRTQTKKTASSCSSHTFSPFSLPKKYSESGSVLFCFVPLCFLFLFVLFLFRFVLFRFVLLGHPDLFLSPISPVHFIGRMSDSHYRPAWEPD